MADGRIEKGRATRERLVDVGRVAFGERGFDATTITEILDAADVAKGALYHHFDSKAALFDAVLDSVVRDAATAAAESARSARRPAGRLKAGCGAWLEMTLDPAFQRIALIDAPAVVGWSRIREIDARHTLDGIRRNLIDLDRRSRVYMDTDLLAHMLLAAVNEAALFIARSENPSEALAVGRRTVDALIDRLVS